MRNSLHLQSVPDDKHTYTLRNEQTLDSSCQSNKDTCPLF